MYILTFLDRTVSVFQIFFLLISQKVKKLTKNKIENYRMEESAIVDALSNEEDGLLKSITLDLSVNHEEQTEDSNEIINISTVFKSNSKI
jgi:hypothetical protein